MISKDLLKILDNVSKDKDEPTFKKHDRILIIDGLNLFLRNFSVINTINQHGVHIGGLSGFLRSLSFLIKQTQPTSVYIVFDGVGSSINRKNLLPEYKSNRNTDKLINWEAFQNKDDEDDAKLNQISRLIHYLRCLPVKVIALDRVEADDIIAHLSDCLSTSFRSKVYIVSQDMDFLQKVNKYVTVFRPIEKEFYTPEKMKASFGLPVENYILYKVLLGDKSDVVKGIKGLGKGKLPKLFPELYNDILTLDDIFDICTLKYKDHIIYSRILFEKENIIRNYKLMDLSNPLVDDGEKEIIEDLISMPIPILKPNDFLKLYKEDGLNNLFKDVSWWLRETFKVINSFNK